MSRVSTGNTTVSSPTSNSIQLNNSTTIPAGQNFLFSAANQRHNQLLGSFNIAQRQYSQLILSQDDYDPDEPATVRKFKQWYEYV